MKHYTKLSALVLKRYIITVHNSTKNLTKSKGRSYFYMAQAKGGIQKPPKMVPSPPARKINCNKQMAVAPHTEKNATQAKNKTKQKKNTLEWWRGPKWTLSYLLTSAA